MRLSIIVPVYNMDKYIHRCLSSLQKQKVDFEYEVIVVNDGSTDDSDSIIKNFERSDKRFIYIKKVNAGVSEARNVGLSLARGEYVSFVDADDYVDSNYCELTYNAAAQAQADILMFGHKLNDSSGVEITANDIENITIVVNPENLLELFCKYFLSVKYSNYAWNKLYRRELITANKAMFPTDINFAEDRFFNYQLYPHCSTLRYINESPYHYYRHSESVSVVYSQKNNFISSYLKVYRDSITLWNLQQITELKPIQPVILMRMLQGAFFYTIQTVKELDILKKHFMEAVCDFPLENELKIEDMQYAIDIYANYCGLSWFEKSKMWLFALSVIDGGDAIVEWQKLFPIYSNTVSLLKE